MAELGQKCPEAAPILKFETLKRCITIQYEKLRKPIWQSQSALV